jgi:hypothetical protein
LFARHVMPHFQGSLSGIMVSNRWASERKEALHGHAVAGLKQATDAYFSGRN